MSRIVKACSWPGCYRLPAHRKSRCYTHDNLHYGGRHARLDQRKRARLLAEWLTRPKHESSNPRPLTPQEEIIYKHELNQLLTKFPPQSSVHLAWLSGLASKYARRGGKAAYQRHTGIQARVAGWRRKWLREGSYDHQLLEQLLTDKVNHSTNSKHAL